MKTEHTPEPWFWNEKYGEVCFRSKEDDQSYGMACPVDLTEEANARRIVACVNACAGIPDEQLYDQEPGCLLSAMVEQEQEIMAITKQRDELLAAINFARQGYQAASENGDHDEVEWAEMYLRSIDTAIASVKGS